MHHVDFPGPLSLNKMSRYNLDFYMSLPETGRLVFLLRSLMSSATKKEKRRFLGTKNINMPCKTNQIKSKHLVRHLSFLYFTSTFVFPAGFAF